jgi:3-isopropylmalate/(R)-2-methylmalate dehydratase small subunit
MNAPARIEVITGRAIPLRGDHIDTDRIMPARFLRSVTFDGLEAHLFEDDRRERTRDGQPHPFADARYGGATILLVNRNFGCGSSREHAPQGLHRWGIRAVVGESFSEIFLGNCTALGMPCLAVGGDDAAALIEMAERDPETTFALDVRDATIETGGRRIAGHLPAAVQSALAGGTWDATGMLLENYEEVEAIEKTLPYRWK